jgi:hypothetical protein
MAPDVISQTNLGELRIFGLDGFKEAAPSFSPLTFDPLLKSDHVGSPKKLQAKTEKTISLKWLAGDFDFKGLSGCLVSALLQ